MIAALVAAQHEALAGLPPGTLPGPTPRARRSIPATCKRDESWRVALARILERIDVAGLPEAALQARTALAAASASDLEALADRFLQGDVQPAEAAEMVFVAAALQVAWTRMAALLDAGRARSGRCRPVPGLRLAAGRRHGGAGRHQVRPSPSALLALRHGLALRADALRALRQHRQDLVPPVRRHVVSQGRVLRGLPGLLEGVLHRERARRWSRWPTTSRSLGLDVLVGEEGFARVANPFVLGVMAEPDGNN